MARTSRTVDPSGGPYRWENHRDRWRGLVVENELDSCLQEKCNSQHEYDMFRAEVQARIERAEAGGLGVPGMAGPDPVVTQPALWEIRWSFAGGRELRSYHAEPVAHHDLLLGLKFHWKRFEGLTVPQVDAAQNAEMAEAAQRFRDSSYHGQADD